MRPCRTAIAAQGDALSSWGESGSLPSAYVSQRAPTGVRTAPARQDAAEATADPALAINERGNAVLAWMQSAASNGATRIVVRSYTSGR